MGSDSPGAKAVAAFGSVRLMAEATGIPEKTIYRWTSAKSKGGSDGMIPSDRQGIVLAAAKRLGLALTAEDLVAMPDDAASAGAEGGA